MLTAKEISNKKFEKAAFGGYKIEEVDEFLKEVAIEFAQLQKDKEESEKKIDILADKVREYMKDEDVLKAALLGAQRQGHKIIDDAKQLADQIIFEAKEKASQVTSQIQAQIEAERATLANMQREVSDFKAKLLSLYKSHLDIITALPDSDDSGYSSAPEQEQTVVEEPSEETAKEDVKAEEGYPFHSPSKGAENRYTDLKFGQNNK